MFKYLFFLCFRAVLLHTHWHSFTMLAEEDICSTLSLRKDLSSILTAQPLNPKWLSLPKKFSRHVLFRYQNVNTYAKNTVREGSVNVLIPKFLLHRRLAEVSRLTRGVVVLICDIHYVKLVMDQAKRLNMLEGHFFWLWIDASKDIDIFHNIANRTQFNEDNDQEIENLMNKETVQLNDRFDRSKRDDVDNNMMYNVKDPDTQIRNDGEILDTNLYHDEVTVKNTPNSLNFSRNNIHINKTKVHIADNKLLDNNYNKSYDSEGNISSDDLRNYNVNNEKGVESSKIKNNSIEKGYIPIHNSDSKRRRNRLKEKNNESFNKYVNSIHVDDMSEVRKQILEREIRIFNQESTDIKDKLSLASDISDFLLNPTVQSYKMHTVRDAIEKRSDRIKMMRVNDIFDDDKEDRENYDNITVIMNSLPIGLLALHPQPVKIGKTLSFIDNFTKV